MSPGSGWTSPGPGRRPRARHRPSRRQAREHPARTDGRALVTDFGIARLADDAEGSVPGTILGSVQYFSPEQARGATTARLRRVRARARPVRVPHRAPAWSARRPAAIALARIGAPAPSPRAIRPEVPVALDAVVVRALDPDPVRRYPDGTGLAAALERLLVAPAAPPRAARAAARARERPHPEPRAVVARDGTPASRCRRLVGPCRG